MDLDKTKIEELLQKDLFKELGLDGMPTEEKLGLAADISKVVMQGMFLKVMEHLKPEDRVELDKMTTGGAEPEVVQQFIESKIPNLEDVLKEAVAEYKEMMLAK